MEDGHMTHRKHIAIGAAALTLGFSFATLATAASEPQGAYSHRVSPPSSNPHDVFRTVVNKPRKGSEQARMANCDCSMMTGDAVMRDMCVGMGDQHRTGPSPKAG
jgi:hypothetical protein